MRKNQANQVVSFQAIAIADGSNVTTGTPTVYYTIEAGTQGTGAGASTHEGNGQWSYVPAQAETNGDQVAYTFSLTNAISQTVNVYPVAFDPSDSVRMGLTSLPNAAADAAGGLVISDAGGLDMDALNTAAARLTASRAQVLDDWINGGRLDLLLDAVNTVAPDNAGITTTVNELANGTDGLTALKAAIDSRMAEVSINTTGGAVDVVTLTDTTTTNTDMRGTDGANTTVPDNASIASILTDTGATIPAQITGLNNLSAAEILTEVLKVLTTQMTESYAADGTAPTLTQALMLIQQSLTEFAYTGTSNTVKKLDGITTAAVMTLDDAANPTSATRTS